MSDTQNEYCSKSETLTMSKGCIVVSCYSRPDAFRKLITSIYNAESAQEVTKLFIVQDSNPELISIIDKFKDSRTITIGAPAPGNSPLQNINLNRWNSQIIAFDILDSDWVLALEEDVEIHASSLIFIESIFQLKSRESKFRGINLGSYEIEGELGDFSIVQQGLHGQAAMITKTTWQRIKAKVRKNDLLKYAYDWLVEPVIRGGYMIVPNLSLFQDHGWTSPTHAPIDPNDSHYLRLSRSLSVAKSYNKLESVRYVSSSHSWFGTEQYQATLLAGVWDRVLNCWKFSKIRRNAYSVYEGTKKSLGIDQDDCNWKIK